MTKRYQIHCDFCGKRVIVKDAAGLRGLKEIPQAPIPGGVPYMDPEGKGIKEKKSLPRKRMLKCPCCGRGLILRQDTTVLTEIEEEKPVEEDFSLGREASTSGQQVPVEPAGGTPPGRSEVPQ